MKIFKQQKMIGDVLLVHMQQLRLAYPNAQIDYYL
jgi:hypothetical protein